MAIDYGTPRKHNEKIPEEPLEKLKSRCKDSGDAVIDENKGGAADSFELSGADLSNEGFLARVVPKRDDEFVCSQCFTVHRASQLAYGEDSKPVCVECIGWGYTGKNKERIKPPAGGEEAWARSQGKARQKTQLI